MSDQAAERHLDECRVAIDLICQADEANDMDELRSHALYLVEHFEELDRVMSAGNAMPGSWRRI